MISYFLGILSPVRSTNLLPYSILTSSSKKCGFLHVCVQALQSCLTLCDPMDCNLPGSCVHVVILAIILECIAISSSRRSTRRPWVFGSSSISRQILCHWATWEVCVVSWPTACENLGIRKTVHLSINSQCPKSSRRITDVDGTYGIHI